MVLNFNINNQIITRTDGEIPVANSRNYLKAKFNFQTAEWDAHEKTAIFRQQYKVRHVLLDENMECYIPYELLDAGMLSVSVFAGDLITANSCLVKILRSGYEDGTKPDDPTPDIYEQILKKIEEISARQVDPEQIKVAVDEYLEKNPIETLSEQDVQKIVASYVTEHKDELKGDKGDPGEKGADGEPGADGADGKDGTDGVDGYTPVRGTDYWTPDDIKEIQSYIDQQIGGALNGSY